MPLHLINPEDVLPSLPGDFQANRSIQLWNGSEWVIYNPTFEYVSSKNPSDWVITNQTTEEVINQQANVPETYLSVSVTPDRGGIHKISVPAIWSHNVTADNVTLQLSVSGGAISGDYNFSVQEAGDSAGTGFLMNVVQGGLAVGDVNNATDTRNMTGAYEDFFMLDAGATYVFSLRWFSETANDEAAILRASICVEQKTVV